MQAFLNAYQSLSIPAKRVETVNDFEGATGLILPGVGSFDNAMSMFNNSGLRNSFDISVNTHKVPVLGVCIGMHMLSNGSEEGKLSGLGWVPGKVCALSKLLGDINIPIPHMGWNLAKPTQKSELFPESIESPQQFYFLHSFIFCCDDQENVVAKARYGTEFDVAIRRENIFGVQFHPEKSHTWGLGLLKNFYEVS